MHTVCSYYEEWDDLLRACIKRDGKVFLVPVGDDGDAVRVEVCEAHAAFLRDEGYQELER